MLIVDLTGSHYEMGQQHGLKLLRYRPALLGLIADYQEKVNSYLQQDITEIVEEISDVLCVHSPQTLDMIHGIADGFEVSRRDILSMMMGSYIEDRLAPLSGLPFQEDGCTSWAISKEKARQDKVLLAKNRDYLVSHRPLQVIFRCKPEGGHRYLSINSIGACNVFSSGMNTEGLTIADTRVPSMDVGPGLPRFSLMMHILENFRSVNEVINYLTSVPRMGGGNLIFADAKGAIGRAEIGYEGLGILQESAGFLVCTNHFEEPSMQEKYRKRNETEEKDSKWRFDKVFESLVAADENMDSDLAAKLMAYHDERFAICHHRNSKQLDETTTISSTIFLPERRGFYFCEGFPCTDPFYWISF
jgi:predicted choloylglycine hydrolase